MLVIIFALLPKLEFFILSFSLCFNVDMVSYMICSRAIVRMWILVARFEALITGFQAHSCSLSWSQYLPRS